MANFDSEAFLNQPIYAFDFRAMMGDVRDFLEFSERNIEWLYEVEKQRIKSRAETEDLPQGYEAHLCSNAEHRFRVALPMRIRYAACLATVSAVEWQVNALRSVALFEISKRPERENQTVRILRQFEKEECLTQATVSKFTDLVCIRNRIAHDSGVVPEGHPKRAKTEEATGRLEGFSIRSWHFFGDCIFIDKEALAPLIGEFSDQVARMFETAHKKGLLK